MRGSATVMQNGSDVTATAMGTVRGVAAGPGPGPGPGRGADADLDPVTATTGHIPGPGRVTVGKSADVTDGYQPNQDSRVSW